VAIEDPKIVGKSPSLAEAVRRAVRVACAPVSVIILGESGTGKELVARRIHVRSQRANQPFVAVNCGAIPATLVEAELFGHERGAFTGATVARTGYFERADGGTLFLDEIGELPLDQQVKILRVLQEAEIQRVGASQPRRVDVRIVAATNRDLKAMVNEGAFRDDLYYRLAKYRIELPPLRDRGRDVIEIARHFIETRDHLRGKRLSRSAERLLLRCQWDGNIRELENVIEAAAIDTTRDRISKAMVERHLESPLRAETVTSEARLTAIADLLRERGRVTELDVRHLLGTSKATNCRLFSAMESAQLIERRGNGRGTHFVLPQAEGSSFEVLPPRQREFLARTTPGKRFTRKDYLRLSHTDHPQTA
jgi:transcriptional regulator with GAF, ATPase, and Fis domain